MARNKSEKLPSCPEAIAYAENVEANGDGNGRLWYEMPEYVKTEIADERRRRKNALGRPYNDPPRRDWLLNAKIIRERYAA